MPGPPTFRPLQTGDTSSPRRLEDYLRELERQVVGLTEQLNEAKAQKPTGLTDQDLLAVKDALESGGRAQLDLTNLPGVVATSVDARIPRVSAHPDPYSTPYDTYVLTGSPDTLWQINREVNPPVAVQIAFVPVNLMTLDTPQIVTAAGVKTVQASWTFEVDQFLLNALNALLLLSVRNTNAAGNAAMSSVRAQASTAIIQLSAFGAAFAGSVFGQALAGWSSLNNGAAGSGILLGTLNNTPIIIGTNDVERLRVDATGTQITAGTLRFAPAASQIVPGVTSISLRNNANSADNVLVTDAGDVTIRGDCSMDALTATEDSTITGGGLALRVNGTNALSSVVVFDVQHSGTTVFEVTGDGDVHLDNNLDVDANLNVDGDATVDGEILLGPATCRIHSRSSDPNGALSANAGDYCFRTDTPSTALQRLYVCTGTTNWTGIV